MSYFALSGLTGCVSPLSGGTSDYFDVLFNDERIISIYKKNIPASRNTDWQPLYIVEVVYDRSTQIFKFTNEINRNTFYNQVSISGGSGGVTSHSALINRDVAGNHAKLIPTVDSTTAIQLTKADGTPIIDVDSTNSRVGINTIAPQFPIHVYMMDETDSFEQTNDIVVDGSALSDKGYVWASEGNRKWQQNIYRGEDGHYLYTYNFNSEKELLILSDRMKVGINTHSNIINYHTTWMNPDTGQLNDCEIGGLFENSSITRYDIKISTTGAIDKFQWRKTINFEDTWTAWSSELNCVVSGTTIDNGVIVYFGSVNGHNLLDNWQINVFPQEPSATLAVRPTEITEINCINDITADPIIYEDQTATLQNNDMPNVSLFIVGDNSAVYVGRLVKFANLYFDIISAGIGVTPVLEFWNGTSWTAIGTTEHLVDKTDGLTKTGNIGWNLNSLTNWTKRYPEYNPSEDGYNLYWMRIRSSSTITQSPIIDTITPNGDFRFATYAAHNDSRPSFFVDAKGRTVIGDATIEPVASLSVNGSIGNKVTVITSDLSLDESHNIIGCENTTEISVSLPTVSNILGRTYTIVCRGTANILIAAYPGETIETQPNIVGRNNKTYILTADPDNLKWRIINIDIEEASEVNFTPNGNIISTNVQDAIVEVRDDAASGLTAHITDYNNPHQVTSEQVAYNNTIFNTTNSEEILDQYSGIINNTLGSGTLQNINYLVYSGVTKLEIVGGSGYLTYENYFDILSWSATTIDFSAHTADNQYYIYVDINGNIQTSTNSPSTTQSIILGRVYWSGDFLANLSQSVRNAKDSLSNIYTYLVRLGGFISDAGCLGSVSGGTGNEMKLISQQGTVWRGLKEYQLTQCNTSDTERFSVYYGTIESWYKNHYESRFDGKITSYKWNDTSKSKEVQLLGHLVTFLNGNVTVTCPDDLTSHLSIGDMIWLYDDGIEYMNNIENIVFGSETTITLSLPYSGTNSVGLASYSQALPNIPAGKYVKHLLMRGLDDNMVLFLGQTLYDSESLAIADGAPETSDTFKTVGIMIDFITVASGDTTLVGKLQDIRPLPFNSRIGGASGGAVVSSHSSLSDLNNDDHTQYLLENGTRDLSGIIKYNTHPTFTTNTDLIDKKYGDDLIVAHNSAYTHADIALSAKLTDVQLKHGFENRTDSTLPLLMNSLDFTISGVNFNIWSQGVKYVKNTQTVSITDTKGIWFIKYNSSGVMSASQTSYVIGTDIPIASVLWNGTEGLVHDERHNARTNTNWHIASHYTTGAKYANGFDLTINNSGFSVESGSYFDDDLEINYAVPTTTAKVLYRDGVDWTWTSAQTDYFIRDIDGNLNYDNAGTLSACTTDYYVVYWMFVTNNVDTPVYVVTGQRQDSDGVSCYLNNNFEDLVLPANLGDIRMAYKIILKNTILALQDWEDYRNVPSLPNTPNGVPHSSIVNRSSKASHPAIAINTDTSLFSGLLTSADKEVQHALNTLSSVSIATLGIGSVTNDAQLKRAAADFNSFTGKTIIASGDTILIEDSEDSYNKKKIIVGDLLKRSITFDTGRSGNANADIDLNRNSIPTSTAPFIVPIDCVLKSISASNSGLETWTAAVLVNDVQVATLAITTSNSAYRNDLNIDILAGDKIRLRFLVGNTGAVNSPSMSIFLIEK
jgi:hypothetical protein